MSWMNGQTELPTSLTRAEVRMSLGMFLSCSTWSSGAAPVHHEQHSKSTGECVTNAATLVLESDVGVEAVHAGLPGLLVYDP